MPRFKDIKTLIEDIKAFEKIKRDVKGLVFINELLVWEIGLLVDMGKLQAELGDRIQESINDLNDQINEFNSELPYTNNINDPEHLNVIFLPPSDPNSLSRLEYFSILYEKIETSYNDLKQDLDVVFIPKNDDDYINLKLVLELYHLEGDAKRLLMKVKWLLGIESYQYKNIEIIYKSINNFKIKLLKIDLEGIIDPNEKDKGVKNQIKGIYDDYRNTINGLIKLSGLIKMTQTLKEKIDTLKEEVGNRAGGVDDLELVNEVNGLSEEINKFYSSLLDSSGYSDQLAFEYNSYKNNYTRYDHAYRNGGECLSQFTSKKIEYIPAEISSQESSEKSPFSTGKGKEKEKPKGKRSGASARSGKTRGKDKRVSTDKGKEKEEIKIKKKNKNIKKNDKRHTDIKTEETTTQNKPSAQSPSLFSKGKEKEKLKRSREKRHTDMQTKPLQQQGLFSPSNQAKAKGKEKVKTTKTMQTEETTSQNKPSPLELFFSQ